MREMKDSGWIRLKYVVDILGRIGFRGYTEQNLVDEGEGAITLSPSNIQNMKMTYEKCSYLTWEKYHESPEIKIYNGDILFVKTGSTYGKTGYVEDLPMEATINPQFVVFKNIRMNNKLLFYILQTLGVKHQCELAVMGGTIPTMSQAKIGNFLIPFPPIDKQQKIAEFLDRECAKIDGLKADIQTQIETLEQYKRSVITEAVTHGLNPSAPMKDSGIPWVDEVPQNWDIRRVKYIALCLKKGNGITKEDIVEDGDTLCIRYGEIYTKYNLSFFECATRTNKDRISSKQYFTQGDILFAGTGELIEEIGKNIVYLGTGDCLAGGDIIILKHKQNARYLNYALNSECMQAQKSCNKAKLKVVHISAFEIGNIKIALPPLAEQEAIAEYLDNKCAEIEQIIADKKSQIETLEEYKKSLIYEYVTGKKEVV